MDLYSQKQPRRREFVCRTARQPSPLGDSQGCRLRPPPHSNLGWVTVTSKLPSAKSAFNGVPTGA